MTLTNASQERDGTAPTKPDIRGASVLSHNSVFCSSPLYFYLLTPETSSWGFFFIFNTHTHTHTHRILLCSTLFCVPLLAAHFQLFRRVLTFYDLSLTGLPCMCDDSSGCSDGYDCQIVGRWTFSIRTFNNLRDVGHAFWETGLRNRYGERE
jgi:hypothetical protein